MIHPSLRLPKWSGGILWPPARLNRRSRDRYWQALAAIFFLGFVVMVYFWQQEYDRARLFQQWIESAIQLKGTP